MPFYRETESVAAQRDMPMPDNGKTPSDVSRAASLARIADALDLPVSQFYAADSVEKIIHHVKLDDAAVLALVKIYLQAVDPAARRHFMDQVRVFADELST
jgi:hypothetical protein